MRTEKFISPCGQEILIRESTGADEDILSSVDEPTETLAKFLSNVVLQIGDNKSVSKQDIKALKLRSKYAILIKCRIFSLGKSLFFTHDWGEGLPKEEYEIDLEQFVWDYSKPFPEPTEPEYSSDRITPYQEIALEKTLSTGREVKMDYLDGFGEEFLIKKAMNARTINLQLSARNFSVMDGGDWVKVKNFSLFTSREMSEIRSIYEKNDPPVEGLITLTNPLTREPHRISLLEIKDFFFPVKIS